MLQRRAVKGVKFKKLAQLFCLIILTSIVFTGCNIPTQPASSSAGIPSYPVAPVLREFYANLGSERYLGPPISGAFDHNGTTCQYTANALMCMNPTETDPTKRFYLEALGNNLNVAEAPDNTADPGSPFTVNNYHVYEVFKVVYDQMNGSINLGQPISNLKYNEEKNRMEQYFENVGFYIQNTPDARVELLPYGYFSCTTCQGPRQQRPTLALPQTAIDQAVVFSNGINRLGGKSIFGNPISETLTRPDGTIEQVYETVAVYATPDQPEIIRFRPLPIILGMPMHPPVSQSSENKADCYFYPIQGKVEGYYVPVVFHQFIQLHGGKQVSGDPISTTFKVDGKENEIFGRQCFTNYCLDYMSVDQAVRIAPLGSLYLGQSQVPAQTAVQPPVQQPTVQPTRQPDAQSAVPPAAQAAAPITSPAMQLLVSEMLPKPASNEYQTLSISVFQPGNSQPIAGVQVIATITPPVGNQQTYTSAPTNANGNTIVSFPPLAGAKHGDVITYQVCITQNLAEPVCQFESYLIWDLN
jgi:hypothetical protein